MMLWFVAVTNLTLQLYNLLNGLEGENYVFNLQRHHYSYHCTVSAQARQVERTIVFWTQA